jgi:deazaflavin-dependent oxidoreductase (nitroreductase family)
MSSAAFDESRVIDSPVGWVADHIKRYVSTDGEDGHWFLDAEMLLISVRGRKSGTWYRTALAYGRDGDNYVVGASSGGSVDHPEWYLNLSANPDVHVQVRGEKFAARASTVSGPERARLWRLLGEVSTDYATFQSRVTREVPVVVLEPLA